MNIRKYFSQNRILSRREAQRYIAEGKVKVNGKLIKDHAVDVDSEKDKVEIVGDVEEKLTLAFYKPRGISCSKGKNDGRNIYNLLPNFKHLNPVGRLDKESEGLILISNDGVLASVVTGRDHVVEKEYVVRVRERVTQSKINALSKGMMLEDGPTLPAGVKMLDDHSFSIVLKEGRNHQIRRMANKVRLTVEGLKRVRIGDVNLGALGVGEWRELGRGEVEEMKELD